MRVERPGCGDCEGGPLRDVVGFDREFDGYKRALQALKQSDFVDGDSVFLFGHSIGGMAPLIAVELPVKRIAVYGSGAGTWFEAVFEQLRCGNILTSIRTY